MRKYDFRNGQIVNIHTGNVIPQDEPVFILRARDCFALAAIQGYLNALPDGCDNIEQINALKAAFAEFEALHPERMRFPSAPQEATK